MDTLNAPFPGEDAPARQPQFTTTHWSVVLAAGAGQDSPQATTALDSLCRTYGYPRYCFIRRQGHAAPDAEDLTRGFLAHLLDRKALRKVSPAHGRFRAFLLAALKYFLANQRDKAQADKRGGRCTIVSLDEEHAEERYQRECVDESTPERLYERRWAMTVLEAAFVRLEAEYARAGKTALYHELCRLQRDESEGTPYAQVAERLGVTVNTLKSQVHRFRQRYREMLCAEVAQTVSSPAEIAVEVRHLLAVVSGNLP